MSETSVGIGAHILTARIVKWDGEPPEGADPIGHPQCIEVIEFSDDGSPPKILHKRCDQ